MRTASATKALVLVAAVLLVGLSATLAQAPSAGARPTPKVVRDGTYGYLQGLGEYVVFKVHNRRVRNLAFNMQILCSTPDSPSAETRYFSGGLEAPQGRKIPDDGNLTLRWQERGEGRLGRISVELRFDRRDIANLAVVVPEERTAETGPEDALESCNGNSSLMINRGFELARLPH